jgi:hypothetical protein
MHSRRSYAGHSLRTGAKTDPDQWTKVGTSLPRLHENEEGYVPCWACGSWVKPRKNGTLPNHGTDGRSFRVMSNVQTWCRGSETIQIES